MCEPYVRPSLSPCISTCLPVSLLLLSVIQTVSLSTSGGRHELKAARHQTEPCPTYIQGGLKRKRLEEGNLLHRKYKWTVDECPYSLDTQRYKVWSVATGGKKRSCVIVFKSLKY